MKDRKREKIFVQTLPKLEKGFNLMEAEEFLDSGTELLILPLINLMYEDGQLRDKEREDLFAEVLERLGEYVEKYDLKIAVSLSSRGQGQA